MSICAERHCKWLALSTRQQLGSKEASSAERISVIQLTSCRAPVHSTMESRLCRSVQEGWTSATPWSQWVSAQCRKPLLYCAAAGVQDTPEQQIGDHLVLAPVSERELQRASGLTLCLLNTCMACPSVVSHSKGFIACRLLCTAASMAANAHCAAKASSLPLRPQYG